MAKIERESRRSGSVPPAKGAEEFLRPLAGEIAACMPWLRMEIALVHTVLRTTLP